MDDFDNAVAVLNWQQKCNKKKKERRAQLALRWQRIIGVILLIATPFAAILTEYDPVVIATGLALSAILLFTKEDILTIKDQDVD